MRSAFALIIAFTWLAQVGCGDNAEGHCISIDSGGTADAPDAAAAVGDVIPLKEAKLNIEHNATDLDTGFQGFIDGEGWQRLDVKGPDGSTVFTLEGKGSLRELGLTELFFESVEPENAEVPIEDVLATLPEGEYTIEGPAVDGELTRGTALLTHDIPKGPVLVFPEEGATVPAAGLVVRWEPVTETIDGDPVAIAGYEVIVETDDEPHPHALSKTVMSVHLPPTADRLTVPPQFLDSGTTYLWEVLAIEESGNQTLSSGEFTTE